MCDVYEFLSDFYSFIWIRVPWHYCWAGPLSETLKTLNRLRVCGTRWKCQMSVFEEPNWSQNSKTAKLSFRSLVWGRFFPLSHSQFIFQHDRINSQKYFSSCHISSLLVLSHFVWQSVGPIQHGSMPFLVSYHRGINERFFIAVNPCPFPFPKTVIKQ